MRVLAGLILSATVVFGQSVEATVFLPESLCGLGWIEYLAWNPANNHVYAANWHAGNVIAMPAGTGEKTARIPAGEIGGVTCVNADLNKVYAYDQSRQTLAVIDGNTNTVARRVFVPFPWPDEASLAYSPRRQKLYCLASVGQLAVLDAVTDSVTKCLSVNDGGNTALLYNAAADKLYSPTEDYGISVIDGATDTTVATLGVDVNGFAGMVANDSTNKAYFLCYQCIAVVSGAADTVRSLIWLTGEGVGTCCNRATNRIYAAYRYVEPSYGPTVAVVDGSADTIIKTVALSSEPTSIVCSPTSNRVYVGLANDSVAVIDCASNQVVSTLYVGAYTSSACYAAANDAVFVSFAGASLAKIDCPSNSVVHNEDLGCEPGAIACADEEDRLYVLDRLGRSLNIVDGSTYQVRHSQYLSPRPTNSYQVGSLAYNRALGRMYVALGDSGLAVFDCATDSLLRILDVPAQALVYDSVRRKVYCAGNSSFWVLSADAETVLTEIPELAATCALCLSAGRGKLYTGTGYPPYGIHVIDCDGDTILRVLENDAVYSRFAHSETYDKLYAHKFGGKLLIIDCATDRVDSLLPGGQAIGDVSVNEDGTKFLCYGEGGPTLVLDCATDSVIAELDTVEAQSEGWSRAVGWSHDNRRIYVPSWHMGVVVLDAENGGADSIRTGNFPMGVLVHPTADRVYVANAYSSSLTVISDEVGIAERPGFKVTAGRRPMPSVIRGLLFMPEATGRRQQAASLLDISGRKVLDLRRGANDVRALSQGVYFVHRATSVGRGASSVTKVVITR